MKHSIARKVTGSIAVCLFVALAALFAASYLLVQNIVSGNTKDLNRSVLRSFAEMVKEDAAGRSEMDRLLIEDILADGEYLCERYNIDFAYMFRPADEPGKITYVCVAQNERFDDINPDDKYIGKVTGYVLTADEDAVWRGEKEVSDSITRSKTGHEVSTMIRLEICGKTYMAGIDQSYEGQYRKIVSHFLLLAGAIILVTAGIYLSVYLIIKKRVSKPAAAVSRAMAEYITDGRRSDEKLEVKGDDEFSAIGAAFNSMTDDISGYLTNIDRLTHEREQQTAQLDISAQIQRGFLKKTYYEADGCLVYADMVPAKYVAGDLYDYMPLGDGKFLTVIADVSGKGVAASIFMAVTLILIREFAKMAMSPKEILSRVNRTLAENNAQMLFSTAICGIYDETAKTYTYANAGHNLPYVLKNGEVTVLGESYNTFLGIFPEEDYREVTVPLDTGDTLFLYTDGVTEATNADNEFYGEARLTAALQSFTAAKKENIVDYVKADVAAFSGDADQHDDITMLAFTPGKTKKLVLPAKAEEFAKIRDEILKLPIPRAEQLTFCLAAEEFFINICSYAYEETGGEGTVRVSVNVSDRITLRFADSGVPFDPTKDVLAIEDYDYDHGVGGLGRFIAVNNIDDAKYEYRDGENILTLTKFPVNGV